MYILIVEIAKIIVIMTIKVLISAVVL